jgi:UDP-N-acetylmuramate dehydrogenase
MNEPLSRQTYYRIGGAAAVFAVPKSLEDLDWLAQGIQETGVPFFILGLGSNVLAPDEGFPGLIIRTHRVNLEINLVSTGSPGTLRVGASVPISSLLRRCALEGWDGLEFLSGIPGSVGGAIKMNAGTHIGETKDHIKKVTLYSLDQFNPDSRDRIKTVEGSQLKFNYRKNLFMSVGDLAWVTEWQIQQSTPSQVKEKIDQLLIRRKATQPIDFPSCGSVFKNPNPPMTLAWQIVDQLGLRGHLIGGAQFSEKHSNWIINRGNASAKDVLALIHLAKQRALQELGIQLEEEVVYLVSALN